MRMHMHMHMHHARARTPARLARLARRWPQGGYRFARSGLDFMLGGIEEYPTTAPKMILISGWSAISP